MFDSLLDRFLARKDGTAPLTNKISFDVTVKFLDERRKELNNCFATPEDRDAFIEDFVSKPRNSRLIDSVCFEDTLTFWRRNVSEDAVPATPPKLPGQGELVLRIRGSGGMVIETMNDDNIPGIIDVLGSGQKKFCAVREIAALRRRVVYERRSVLVKSNEVPASARPVESD